MKQAVLTALLLLSLIFLLPLLLFGTEGTASPSASPLPALTAQPSPAPVLDKTRSVTLLRTADGQIETLTLEDYLWGVVAAEMPASFQSEALKAQCVAARTYALRKGGGVTAAHPDAMVCDDITCCQAYLPRSGAGELWGEESAFYTDKIAQAVRDTDGLVLQYEGELIDAVFHSSSAGSTADAAEVWGSSVPYLVPVDTPEGEEVPNYHTTVAVSPETFTAAVKSLHPEARFGEDYTAWFSSPTYTASGAVAVLPAGGAQVTGLEYRSLFSLRSARFTLSVDGSGVTFHVTGYGHGVGMSQYGANALAADGMDFSSILAHYYTGCQLAALS